MYLIKIILTIFFSLYSFSVEKITDFSQIKNLTGDELSDLMDELEYSDADEYEGFIFASSSEIKLSDLKGNAPLNFIHSVYDNDTDKDIKSRVALSNKNLALIKSSLILAYSEAGDPEVSADYVTTVGDLYLSADLVLFKGEVAALKLALFQSGAYNEDESYGPHFDTEAEAINKGWDVSADVSWSSYVILDYKGEILYSHYWEWTGW